MPEADKESMYSVEVIHPSPDNSGLNVSVKEKRGYGPLWSAGSRIGRERFWTGCNIFASIGTMLAGLVDLGYGVAHLINSDCQDPIGGVLTFSGVLIFCSGFNTLQPALKEFVINSKLSALYRTEKC